MGIAKFDDGIPDNPKHMKAGAAASWLWFCSVIYCRRGLTDGFIPKAKVPGLVVGLSSPFRHAATLVDVGLWDVVLGGYEVHDYLDWNPSKAQIEAYRKQDKERKQSRRSMSDSISESTLESTLESDTDSRPPRLTRAGATSESESKSASKSEQREEMRQRFLTFWAHYPRKVNKPAAEKAFRALSPSAELFAAMLDALARQSRQLDWLKDHGQFVPHAASWLRGRRWEDEAPVPARPRTLGPAYDAPDWQEECREFHEGRCGNRTFHDAKMAEEKAAS